MGYRRFFSFGTGAVLTLSLVGLGCSSSGDTPGTGGSAGNSTGTGGTTGVGGTGGTTGTGGDVTGSGGTTGMGGSGAVPASCPGLEAKNAACTPAFPEGTACKKTCGPDSIGYKAETCTGGIYLEGSCQYTPVPPVVPANGVNDYSCYKLPAAPAMPTACPVGTQASAVCATPDAGGGVPICQACGPDYLDSSGAPKVGYCVCNSAGKWTCGSTSSNSWPCPGSPGC